MSKVIARNIPIIHICKKNHFSERKLFDGENIKSSDDWDDVEEIDDDNVDEIQQ
jgi:hypothetical protein